MLASDAIRSIYIIAIMLGWHILSQPAHAQPITPMPTLLTGDIFYLAPDVHGVTQIHQMTLNEAIGQPITQATVDIYYYDVAPDADYLVYAMRTQRGGTSDIMRLDADRTLQQLTDCRARDMDCRRPKISPDGTQIAFERMIMNGGDVPSPPDDPEIWLWDDGRMTFVAPGMRPTWQADGTLIYESLDAITTPTLAQYDDTQARRGTYLQQDNNTINAFIWVDTIAQAQPLTADNAYTYTALTPSPDGEFILFERTHIATHTPELILYDWQTHMTRFLARGHSAQWR